ncbi:MAG TPA: type 1 glutamine amidotransferase, partial [Caldithrix sp.]|nr:type 1 glutamine amidotransferase [Caldithrix sp.]
MHIHYIQHVPFEGLGSIEPTLIKKGYSISVIRIYKDDPLPVVSEIDWLIVLGGPMGVLDEKKHPWLKTEKKFIRDTIQAGKIVLGICLGSQLIAEALGAKVYKNKYREIGWFDININPDLNHTLLNGVFPSKTIVFHWHGDTFNIPEGAIPIAASEATPNQGFVFDNRVIALQFHLEITPASAGALIENCRDELDG